MRFEDVFFLFPSFPLGTFFQVAERREIKSTRDVQMMVIGNKRDLIKNQRPRTRRTTNAAGKEVILERSTEVSSV